MKLYNFNINGVEKITQKRFDTPTQMRKWTEKALRRSGSQLPSVVIVSLEIVNKITPKHFIKHKFTAVPDGRKQCISYERI